MCVKEEKMEKEEIGKNKTGGKLVVREPAVGLIMW